MFSRWVLSAVAVFPLAGVCFAQDVTRAVPAPAAAAPSAPTPAPGASAPNTSTGLGQSGVSNRPAAPTRAAAAGTVIPASSQSTPPAPLPGEKHTGTATVVIDGPPSSVTSPVVPGGTFTTAGSCCSECQPGCDCGPRFWATTDVLIGWIRSERLPPFVTTSPAGTPTTAAGVLGNPATSFLVGGGTVNGDARLGTRLTVGYVLDPERGVGIEAGGFMTESNAALFSNSTAANAIIARPFTDATTGLQNSVLVSFPGTSAGNVVTRVRSGNLYETHVDFTETYYQHNGFRLDALLGYRFFRYDENLQINQNLFPTSANFVAGTQIANEDTFATRNSFNGIDLGLHTFFSRGALSVDVLTKVAVGRLERQVKIGGSDVLTVPGSAPVISLGGVLAQTSNIGSNRTHQYTLLPELGLNVGYKLMDHLTLRLGYDFLVLGQVARANESVDFNVNPNLFPRANGAGGPNFPAFLNPRADVWLQAISLGAEFSF